MAERVAVPANAAARLAVGWVGAARAVGAVAAVRDPARATGLAAAATEEEMGSARAAAGAASAEG